MQITCPKCQQLMKLQAPQADVQVKCPGCGSALKIKGQGAKQVAASRPAQVPETPLMPTATPAFAAPRQHSATKKPANKTAVIAACAGVAAILLVGVVFVAFRWVGGSDQTQFVAAQNETTTASPVGNPMPETAAPYLDASGGRSNNPIGGSFSSEARAGAARVRDKVRAIEGQASQSSPATRPSAISAEDRQRQFELDNRWRKEPFDALFQTVVLTEPDAHQQAIEQFIELGKKVQSNLDRLVGDGDDKAASAQIQQLNREYDALRSTIITLAPVNPPVYARVIETFRGAGINESNALEASFRRFAASPQASQPTLNKLVRRTQANIASTLNYLKYLAVPLPAPDGNTPRGEFAVLEFFRQLYPEIHAVQSPEDYERLDALLAGKAAELKKLRKGPGFSLKLDGFGRASKYKEHYQRIGTSALDLLQRKHSQFGGQVGTSNYKDFVAARQDLYKLATDSKQEESMFGDDDPFMNDPFFKD